MDRLGALGPIYVQMFKSTFSTISRFGSSEISCVKSLAQTHSVFQPRKGWLKRHSQIQRSQTFENVTKSSGFDGFPNHCKNGRFGGRFDNLFVICGAGYTKVHMHGNVGLFEHIQLHRLEHIGLKAFLDSRQPVVTQCLEVRRFGCHPNPLQKRTVRCRFGYVFVYCGVGKQRFKRTEMSA